ncbi:MAG: isocitrate lyase/PEP mutase family protein [Deltaproteobacteria bacterium]|nr:isocitrate lyase/PEP mutase family protein [Deltaproteobacteria bacterium]
MDQRRKQFRKLLDKGRIITAPGAFDALSARIIEQAGFPAVYLTGGGLSRSWGFPDLGLMTMMENAAFIARVCDSVEIPVIADADTGYGNALNVVRTVREYERTGVAAFHLEDQVTPKRCGHYEGKSVVSENEMIRKIQAAVDARRDPNLSIIARTDARAGLGLDEAIERGKAYARAGADVIFIEAPESVEELRRIGKEIDAPLLANMVKGSRTPLLPADELEGMGYRIAIFPNEAHRAAIWAVRACVQHLRDKGTTADFENMVDFASREKIVGKARWQAMEEKYLQAEE